MALRSFLTHPALPFLKGAFLMAFLAVLIGSINLGGGFDMPEKATDAEMMQIRPAVEGSPAALVAANDCWTGEAPSGVVPGHVVVTVDGTSRVGGERMVGMALEQIFDGVDHGLTVAGFCR